jgi:hypothetical protein
LRIFEKQATHFPQASNLRGALPVTPSPFFTQGSAGANRRKPAQKTAKNRKPAQKTAKNRKKPQKTAKSPL